MEIDPTTPSIDLMEEEPLLEDRDVIKVAEDKVITFINNGLAQLDNDQHVAKMKVAL